MSDTDTQEDGKPLGLQRTECWSCGYDRLIYESCPECGGSCKPLKKRKQQKDSEAMTDVNHIIERLEEALERQQEEEGKIASTPTVGYCVEHDVIAVDRWSPEGHHDHVVLSADGYEFDSIGPSIELLRYLQEEGAISDSERA